MDFNIDKYKEQINSHIDTQKNNEYYSIQLLEQKLENYSLAIREELKYNFYETLKEKGYDFEEIQAIEDELNVQLATLSFKFNNNDIPLDTSFLDAFKDRVDAFANKLVRIINTSNSIGSILEDEVSRTRKENEIRNIKMQFRDEASKIGTSIKNNYKIESLDIFMQSLNEFLNFDIYKYGISNFNSKKLNVKNNIETIKKQIISFDINNKKEKICDNIKCYMKNILKIYEMKIKSINDSDMHPKESDYYRSSLENYNESENKDILDKTFEEETLKNIMIETSKNNMFSLDKQSLDKLKETNENLYYEIKSKLLTILN